MFFQNEVRDMPPPRFQGGFARPSEPAAADQAAVDAVVKWFNAEKGFGFAELADGSGDVFLHIATVQAAGHDSVGQGAKLSVTVAQGQKGRQVTRVLSIDDSEAVAAPAFSGSRPPRGGSRDHADMSSAVDMTGAVKWFSPEKGMGFVEAEDGGRDIFVHISVVEGAGLADLAEGQRVSMRIVETPKGRKAVSIAAA